MGDFYSHDWMDDEDYMDSSAKRNTRSVADALKKEQQFKSAVKGWINEKLDKMSPEDLEFVYNMSVQVPEMRAFFKVFKELQNENSNNGYMS